MPIQEPYRQLEELAGRLSREGLCARLDEPLDRPPTLHVINPDMPVAEEHVIVESVSDEAWFWWAWAERIAPAHDIDTAITGIRRVLGDAA
ncbi:hypothetical protein SAMN04489712_12078 [Thermomonospora echinospora]|uniref:Uncharacterized protein n=1 Tax=Thermomonospora echinospora TaxID=1992 RepID=A0A1H6DPS5_9ACTN|nr:hypothetical protein [Thermomonospora echinospora]SEG87154.1 hypothetical protein SAMN04489712_12078 [Thermomonospora echinospora]